LWCSGMRSGWPRREAWSDAAGSAWPMALTGSLVLMAGLSVVASVGLPGLWRQIFAQLSAIEFWAGLKQPGPGGIIILPILMALLVPLLVAITAVFSFFFPLVLLARL